MVSYGIADGQPSLSQDTSCLPLHCTPWLGQRDFLAAGGGFPEAPRRQRAWLSVRLDSSLGFCLIRAPCFVWKQAGREVAYLLYSLNRWPGDLLPSDVYQFCRSEF
ncbi:hypothetical protein GQ55_2G049600 [Panicum hallii var. hallii]|uniref:Uncharacterized protein n=1 Tax=Panicum hallii var. hallii TaxID=1504633 RepID=A0A2T7ELJ4_9POAL|nr:hypothetical protein GQ55_2G049600 [Panicum hallii var. hallii]